MKKKIKVLIIEDSQSLIDLYKHLLSTAEEKEYEVVTAKTCAEGIALYHQERPDCIILDFVLPDGNGLAVIQKLGASQVPLPVIMATSYGNEQLAVDAVRAGAQHYLVKDKITQSGLVIAINNTIERVAMLNAIEEKNRELQDFLYIISHDFKEPLRTCANVLQSVAKETSLQLNTTAQTQLKSCLNSIQHMQGIVHDLLSHALLGTDVSDFEQFCCHTLVKEVTLNLESFIKGKNAQVTILQPLPEITAIKSLISLLFQNLIQNAIQHNDKDKKQVTIDFKEKPDGWEFSIADNGQGISAEHADHLFVAASGLSICRKILQIHGGKIWYEPGAKEGSMFMFLLPKTPHSRHILQSAVA